MSPQNNTKGDQSNYPKPRKPVRRSNWWWVYFLLLALLLVPSLLNTFSSGKEITWQQFETDIISRKAVDKIIVENNEKVQVYIKKEFADEPYFKDVFKPATGSGIRKDRTIF
jgi:cell division protease FtsH